MSPCERLIQFLAGNYQAFSPLILFKILFLGVFLFYGAFAVIVVRQVSLMTRTLNNEVEVLLKLVAWIHLGVVVMIFLLGLSIL